MPNIFARASLEWLITPDGFKPSERQDLRIPRIRELLCLLAFAGFVDHALGSIPVLHGGVNRACGLFRFHRSVGFSRLGSVRTRAGRITIWRNSAFLLRGLPFLSDLLFQHCYAGF
jgi:hypothetical protein